MKFLGLRRRQDIDFVYVCWSPHLFSCFRIASKSHASVSISKSTKTLKTMLSAIYIHVSEQFAKLNGLPPSKLGLTYFQMSWPLDIQVSLYSKHAKALEDTQMGPLLMLLVLVPRFRETINDTRKIASFLCNLEFLKLFSFLEINFQIGAHLKKGLFFIYFSHFYAPGKRHTNSFSTCPTYIHIRIVLILLTFILALPNLNC